MEGGFGRWCLHMTVVLALLWIVQVEIEPRSRLFQADIMALQVTALRVASILRETRRWCDMSTLRQSAPTASRSCGPRGHTHWCGRTSLCVPRRR